jgi:general secretion pathway protein F
VPVFEYKALDKDGKAVSGVLDADSARDAREKLRARRIFVTDIGAALRKDPPRKGAAPQAPAARGRRGRARGEIAILTRQLSTLLGAGLPITDALAAVVEQTESRRVETVLRDVRERIASGAPFADAIAAHPRYFTDLYVNMVRAGEASGSLDEVLNRVAEFLQRQNRLQNKVMAALTYPAVLVAVGLLVIFILLRFAVPKILTVLKAGGKVLPWPTQILVGVSGFLERYWLLVILACAAAAAVWYALNRTESVGFLLDRMKLKVPVFGDLFRKTAVARFAITFSILLKSGVPVLEALSIVQRVVNNRVLARTLEAVRTRVMEGTDISTPIKKSGVFPPVVGYMIAIGEESGQLENILDRVSEAYEEEVDISTQKMLALLEPIIIVNIAGVVAFIVSAIIWPILKMSTLK